MHWTDAEFESLSWHDVHVHGFRIIEGEYGAGDLCLDLDFIVEWICDGDDGSCRFRIAPAILQFRDATSLRLSIDYATPQAGMCPFSLNEVKRTELSHGPGHRTFQWTLDISWPNGECTFESPGFSQRLTGPIVETQAQYLRPDQRGE